jgi:hypothetical protein
MIMPKPSMITTSVKKRMARFRFLNMNGIIPAAKFEVRTALIQTLRSFEDGKHAIATSETGTIFLPMTKYTCIRTSRVVS